VPRAGEDTTRSEEFVIDPGEPAILVGTPTLLTHQENWMTSQLNYLLVKQSRAELASRAEQARLASDARLPARHRNRAGTLRKPATDPVRWGRRRCTSAHERRTPDPGGR
jgi:hypothetical protein